MPWMLCSTKRCASASRSAPPSGRRGRRRDAAGGVGLRARAVPGRGRPRSSARRRRARRAGHLLEQHAWSLGSPVCAPRRGRAAGGSEAGDLGRGPPAPGGALLGGASKRRIESFVKVL
jgi:hypothetical protein